MIRSTLSPKILIGLVFLASACGAGEEGGSARAPEGAPGAESAESGPGAIPGPETPSPTTTELPDGGLDDWVEQMRDRLEEIELDPRASYPDVLSLYNSHHAAVERYYGEEGRITGDGYPELAAAVQRQDSAFHELMELTGTTDYIERTHLLHAIRNVRLAMEEVLDRAQAAGVSLEPSV